MTLTDDLREAWAISAIGQTHIGDLRGVPLATDVRRTWATINEEDLRGVVLAAAATENLSRAVATVSRDAVAIGAEEYRFTDNGSEMRGLHIWCRDTGLLEPFIAFCETFIAACEGGQTLEHAFSECLAEFRRLVAGFGATSGATGLLGELIILSELVKLDSSLVRTWSYPAGERHDFRAGAVSLEVKTSLRAAHGGALVTIHALDQLQPPPGGKLFLHWLRLDRSSTGDVSLTRLMDEIGRSVSPSVLADLWKRLGDNGVAPEATEVRYEVGERATFQVGDAFPRLTADRLKTGSLDAGLSRVRYDLDLSAAANFRCDADVANTALASAHGSAL